MAKKSPQINNIGQNTNALCFKCKNAYGGCAWSKSFDPVDGWTAEPVKPKNTKHDTSNPNMRKQDYHIIDCPKFIKDGK